MTGNFKEFKAESHTNDPWDEHNAMTSTAVCTSFLVQTPKYSKSSCLYILLPWSLFLIHISQDYLASIGSAAQAGVDIK
jgi:hypothetical protein